MKNETFREYLARLNDCCMSFEQLAESHYAERAERKVLLAEIETVKDRERRLWACLGAVFCRFDPLTRDTKRWAMAMNTVSPCDLDALERVLGIKQEVES